MSRSVTAITLLALLSFLPLTASSAPPNLARGKTAYNELCAKCHGAAGKGDGAYATTTNPRPADLSNCARMSRFDSKQLFQVIKKGGTAAGLSKDMPPVYIEDDEIQDLAAFVRTLCPSKGK